jgi:hypothetical protein
MGPVGRAGSYRSVWWTPVLCVALLEPLNAQDIPAASGPVIQGVLTAEESGIPLGTGAVTLFGAAGDELLTVFADDAGRYSLRAPGAGTYRVRAVRIGYHPQEKGPFTLQATDTLTVDFQLAPAPLLLDSILVSVRRRGEALRAGEQLLYGRLLDNENGEPIPQGLIRLLRPSGSSAAATLSDDSGLFWLVSPSAGTYRLQAERIGYKTSTGPEINLMLGDTLYLDFSLSVEAILLNPIMVRATARSMQNRYAPGGMEDFYERYSAYEGSAIAEFLIRDSIAMYDGWPITAGQMMNRAMMMVDQYSIGSGGVTLRGGCVPQYWVNGTLTQFYPHWALMPEDLEAVEIYEFPYLPPGLTRVEADGFACGVVSIWTRRVPELRPYMERPYWRRALRGVGLLGLVLGVALIL